MWRGSNVIQYLLVDKHYYSKEQCSGGFHSLHQKAGAMQLVLTLPSLYQQHSHSRLAYLGHSVSGEATEEILNKDEREALAIEDTRFCPMYHSKTSTKDHPNEGQFSMSQNCSFLQSFTLCYI